MSEWIEWNAYAPGADCPVDPDELVEIDMKGSLTPFVTRAGSVAWGNGGGLPFVVLRYRIAPEGATPMIAAVSREMG